MFYIKLKTSNKFDPDISEYQLGEISFNKFWPQNGYYALLKYIETGNETVLNKIEIFDDKLAKYTIDSFLDKINGLYIAKRT